MLIFKTMKSPFVYVQVAFWHLGQVNTYYQVETSAHCNHQGKKVPSKLIIDQFTNVTFYYFLYFIVCHSMPEEATGFLFFVVIFCLMITAKGTDFWGIFEF